MAEEQTKPLTLAKTSLTKTKSVAVVLAVCALLVLGVLGIGSYKTGKTSPDNTVGTTLPSGSKGYQVQSGAVRHDKFCDSSNYISGSGYSSRASAETACAADSSCAFIYDQSCDGSGTWNACTNSSLSDSTSGSCVYAKGGGPVHLDASTFALDGSAVVADSTRLDITQLVKGQQGFASYPVDILATAEFQTGWYTHSGPLSVTFDMYIGAAGHDTTGMALGADGMCMNLGAGPGLGALAGGAGEDGVNKGLSVCLDEYANSHHEHGFFIYYNGDEIYADASECDGDNSNSNNVECPPVSLFVTPGTSLSEVWHTVAVTITPGANKRIGRIGAGAQVNVKMSTSDTGIRVYGCSADIAAYDGAVSTDTTKAPDLREGGLADGQAYLSFSARTGAHVNYHSVSSISVTGLA